MQCNSGKSSSAVLVSQILQTSFHWLFYDPGLFLKVVIKKLTKCLSQKFKYLVLAENFERLQTIFFLRSFEVESIGSLSFVGITSASLKARQFKVTIPLLFLDKNRKKSS